MSRRLLVLLVLLFGLTSLFGDVAYEGFRSIISILVENAGGRGVELGGVIGLGEIVNWVLRLATGVLADLFKAYWLLAGLGYALTPLGILVAVSYPRIELVALGVALERLGKAIRTPARDALISGLASSRRGLVFGAHELLDQVGAVAGPLLAYFLLVGGSSFAWLALPGAFTILFLAVARLVYPEKHYILSSRASLTSLVKSLPRMMGVFLVSTALSLAVLHPVVLVYAGRELYSMREISVMLYTIAMLVDAVVAIPLGLFWDRYGTPALAVIPIAGFLGLVSLFYNPWLSSGLTGVALAGLETTLKAYVAAKTRGEERGTGYGAMALGLGAGMAASGVVYSLVIDIVAG